MNLLRKLRPAPVEYTAEDCPEHYPFKRFGWITIYKETETECMPYLNRAYILRIKWLGSIRIHNIVLPDMDRDPHDHPWPFISIVLRGGYTEVWDRAGHRSMRNVRRVNRFSFHRATDLHRIVRFNNGRDTWNLFITGPQWRDWGFQTEDGWRHYEKYVGEKVGEIRQQRTQLQNV